MCRAPFFEAPMDLHSGLVLSVEIWLANCSLWHDWGLKHEFTVLARLDRRGGARAESKHNNNKQPKLPQEAVVRWTQKRHNAPQPTMPATTPLGSSSSSTTCSNKPFRGLGSGRGVTRRNRTNKVGVAGFFSSLHRHADNDTDPENKQYNANGDDKNSSKGNNAGRNCCCCCCSPARKKISCWGFVVASVVVLLGAQLYSHVQTVDPCVRAQLSLGRIETNYFSTRSSTTTTTSSSSSTTTTSGAAAVPKIIHQQWRTDTVGNDPTHPPNRFGDWHEAWHTLFPESEGYQHMLWTDSAMLDLITEHYPWFLPVYNAYPANIQRVDAARYFILYHHGGVYADMDYEPLINFFEYIPSDRVSVIESPYQFNEVAQNSLMASPKGHPFWNAVFNVLPEKAGDWDVLSATGPKLLSAVMEQTPPDYWYLLPCENFQRIPGLDNGSPWYVQLNHRIAPWYPQKSCGSWQKQQVGDCQFGRHHNTALYVQEKGIVEFWSGLIFKKSQ